MIAVSGSLTHDQIPAGRVPAPGRGRERLWVGVALALLLIGAYCRLANLADNPAWDGDEGYNWSIAAHLAHGQVQMFALRYAFVQHPPLFYLLGAALMRLWGENLLVLRALSTACGVLTAVGLLGLGDRLGGRRLGAAAAAAYLIWPQAVLQVRWAYTYNLLALLLVLALWAALAGLPPPGARARNGRPAQPEAAHSPPTLLEPGARTTADGPGPTGLNRRGAALPAAMLAGLLTGMALATDQEALPLLVPLALLLQPRGMRPLLAGLAMAALPPLLYLGWMLSIRPDDLLFDLRHTASRLDGGPIAILARLIHLVQFDPLVGLGLLGLLLLPRGRPRLAVLWLAVLLTVLIVKVRDPNPLFRAAEPLLPLAALGLGALVLALVDLIGRLISSRWRPFTVALLTLGLGLPMLSVDLQGARTGFATGLTATLPHSTVEAQRMAAWVNAHTRPADLVIVMPATAWLLHCRTADLLQAVAFSGRAAGFYPAGLDPARFRYDTRPAAARYLVEDTFTRLWIADSGAISERALLAAVRREWRVVYRRGEYIVYANPHRTNIG